MGKSILISIGTLLVLTLLSAFSGNNFTGISQTGAYDAISFVNGSDSTFQTGTFQFILGFDSLQGAIIWFIAIVLIICFVGIKIVGSGLSEASIKTVRTGLMYGGIWTILSVLAWGLIISITGFGYIIYLTLSIIYTIGVFQKMGDNG